MEPTYKAQGINSFLTGLTGKDREQTIRNGGCMTCDKSPETVKAQLDPRDVPEYRISGMCTHCQFEVFGS
jgi:hypothetical protein